MSIEVGKTYKDRKGNIVMIVEYNEGYKWPYIGISEDFGTRRQYNMCGESPSVHNNSKNLILDTEESNEEYVMDRIAKEVYFYEDHEMTDEDCELLCKKINRILKYYE